MGVVVFVHDRTRYQSAADKSEDDRGQRLLERQSPLPSTDEILDDARPKLMVKMKMVELPFHEEIERVRGEWRLETGDGDLSKSCWTEDRHCLQAYSPRASAVDFYSPATKNLSVRARDILEALLDHIHEWTRRAW